MKRAIQLLLSITLICSCNQKKEPTEQEKKVLEDSLMKILNESFAKMDSIDNVSWSYSESTDKMTGDKTKFATLYSTNTEKFSFPYEGGSTLCLHIRKNKTTDIYITINKGQFAGTYNYETVKLKFDDEKPFNVAVSEAVSGSNDILFLSSEKKLISKLKTSKKLMIEAHFYDEGKRVFEFDVSNLDW